MVLGSKGSSFFTTAQLYLHTLQRVFAGLENFTGSVKSLNCFDATLSWKGMMQKSSSILYMNVVFPPSLIVTKDLKSI